MKYQKALRIAHGRSLNPGYVVQEQALGVQSANERGTILPITSQCTIKMILKLFFNVKIVT